MSKNLIEGVDFYYLEKDGTRFRTFTEKYLLERGYCCKTKCKHCPYGFNKHSNTMSEFKKLVSEEYQDIEKYITHYGKKKVFLEDSNSTYAWGKNPDLSPLLNDTFKDLIKDIHVIYKEKDSTFLITIELK